MDKYDKYIKMYLDYWNNFLTVERFAEYYDITQDEAINIINKGKEIIQWINE